MTVDKYEIVGDDGASTYYNWLQHFDPPMLTADLEASGLTQPQVLGDVAGAAYDPSASGYVPGEVEHHDQWTWPQPFVTYAELVRSGGGLTAVARAHRDMWIKAAEAAPDESSALVISSGGSIEPALVCCLPDADHATWGKPFGHCDGARLKFDAGRFTGLELRRIPHSLAKRGSWPDPVWGGRQPSRRSHTGESGRRYADIASCCRQAGVRVTWAFRLWLARLGRCED